MLGVNTNVASIIAQNAASSTQDSLTTSIQRLSTGLRINSAMDDAAGLAISTRMTAQINGMNQAVLNANFGISLAQTADGALGAATNALQTVRQLALESANASNTSADRSSLDAEAQQLIAQVQTIATQTQFNGQNILDGSFGTAQFQIGANANQTISASMGNIQTSVLGGYSTVGTAVVSGATLAAGTMAINGTDIGAAADGQASSIAAAINSAQSAVVATAATTVSGIAPTAATNLASGDVTINGVNIGAVAGGATAAAQGANVVTAINNVSNATGVTATANSATGVITLTNTTGKDITVVANANGLAGSGFPNATTVTHGKLTLTSSATFTVGNGSVSGAGLTIANVSGAVALSALNAANVTSTANANSAISVVDGALNQINSLRAQLGAVETRFQTVVTSLQASSQNLTSARSRVQDADFAAETANMSKAQILEQAGTAMVAQANSLPSQVLTLLKSA
jgi:flagellin